MKLGPFEFKLRRRRAIVREFAIQSVGDILLQLEAALGGSSTNRYYSRESQAAESIRKYRGQAVKGNLLVKNIINTRSAFTVGRGFSYIGPDDAREFVSEFFRVNGLNLAFLHQLARERCFEGQCLLTLRPGMNNIPRVRFLSWVDTGYQVESEAFDYGTIKGISFHQKDSDIWLTPDQFSFFKFDTRLNSLEGTPLLAGILNTLEDLDDVLVAWRNLNTKFSNPSAYFKFEDENDANAFQTRLKDLNWRWGDSLAGAGEGTVLQIGYGPYQSMLEEIQVKAKIISGHVGVPVHYFGFPDLLNNRAVADDINVMFVSVSEVEQTEWQRGMLDLVGKAADIYNRETGSRLDPRAGRIELELVTAEQWKRIATVWLPLYLADAISLPTLLAKIPGIDETKEADEVRIEIAAHGSRRAGRSAEATTSGGAM